MMIEMIDIPTAREYILGNYPNDPFLRTMAVAILEGLPKVKVLPYEGVEMIRIRFAAAEGEEKRILGDVLRLLEVESDG